MKRLFFLLTLCFAACNVHDTIAFDDIDASLRTTYTISGRVIWEHDDLTGVDSTTVTLSGAENQSTLTDSNGDYSFTVSTLGNYTITPSKTINLMNGVTVADATAIQQHVAGLISINDPYKRVAADVSSEGQLSTLDASIIKQAVLGNPAALSKMNPSWKFVDSSYALVLPPLPYQVPTGYPQSISISLAGDAFGINFVGIKRGDVNGSADPIH